MFVSVIYNCFRTYPEVLSGDTDALAYSRLESREYLVDMVTAAFWTFGLATTRKGLPLVSGSHQDIDLENLRGKVHSSISSFNSEQKDVFNEILCGIPPAVTCSTSTDSLPPICATTYEPQESPCHNPTSIPALYPSRSPSSPSSFHHYL